MIATVVASEYHPFYKDVMDLGFDAYFMQQFISHNKKLEIYLSTYDRIYRPENSGRFESPNEYVVNGHRQLIDSEKITLHLAFIGVSENVRRKYAGTKLLRSICDLADRYNYQIELEIDTKFGTPFGILKKWYEQNGFHYVGATKMIRFRKSLRENGKMFSLPIKYQVIIGYLKQVCEKATKDKGYEMYQKEDFTETARALVAIGSRAKIDALELEALKHLVKNTEMLMMDESYYDLYDEFLEYLKYLTS